MAEKINVLFKAGTAAQYTALETKNDYTFYYTTDDKNLYLGGTKISNASDLSSALSRISGLEGKVGAGTLSAGTDTDIIAAVNSLYTAVSLLNEDDDTKTGTLKKMLKDLKDTIEGEVVNSISAADKSVTVGGTATAPTVKVAISEAEGNALSLATDGLKVTVPAATDYTVTVAESTPEGYVKAYRIQQAATSLDVTINIPKDMVVSAGQVVTFATDEAAVTATGDENAKAGKYLELTIANKTNSKLYISVKDLVDVYTAQASATQVQLAISASNEISATIVAKSITNNELSDAVNTSLGLADSAVQSVEETASTGNNGTITVDGTEVAIKGLDSAAYAKTTDFDAAGSASAVLGTAADTSNKNTVYGAKKYAEEQAADAKLVWGTIE